MFTLNRMCSVKNLTLGRFTVLNRCWHKFPEKFRLLYHSAIGAATLVDKDDNNSILLRQSYGIIASKTTHLERVGKR